MTARGFIDIQANGIAGIDFGREDLTLDDIRTATKEFVRRGTAAFCPTVIEGPDETLRQNLSLLAAAMAESDLAPHLLGVHLEGPFLSPVDGARGAHRPEFLKTPSIKFFDQLWEWSKNNIAILTLAPELDGAEELIRHAAELGVVVAIGHSEADEQTVRMAIAAGASCSTHLGNGIPDLLQRHHNPVWPQLAADELFAGFVTDGHHLPPELIKTAIRAKGIERTIVVSDATSYSGLPPGEYFYRDKPLVMEPSGRLSLKGTKYLAGSSATMLECMNYLASLNLLTEEELWQVGLYNPLKLLGRDASDIADLNGPGVEFDGARFRIKEVAE